MWRMYQPNPLGRLVGDCVIRAISAAQGLSWFESYDILSHYGRKLCNLPNANEVWGAYLIDEGYTRHVIPDTCPNCYTIENFCVDHPKGVFVLCTGSHTVAVINGTYFDAWRSGTEVPQFYYECEEKL